MQTNKINPKEEFLQKVVIKKNACQRSLFLVFQTVVSTSDPDRICIK